MDIYTKTGDKGETSLFDNKRVSKDDIRVESYGLIYMSLEQCVEELREGLSLCKEYRN